MLSVVCKNPGQTQLLIILPPVAGGEMRDFYRGLSVEVHFAGASVMYCTLFDLMMFDAWKMC